jgi:hypothetical protein
MNKTDKNKASTAWHFTTEMFTLTQTGTTTIKLSKTSTSKQLLYKLCFTVEQQLIHETAGLFPVKIEKKNCVVLL